MSKKIFKIIRNIILVILAVTVIFLLTVFIVHTVKSSQERTMLEQAGYVNPVSVGEYSVNVNLYGNENGKYTMVGISGMGSNDFAVTVKPFMEKFSDKNRIAVIDRAGYGMSDDTNTEQTTERIVSDYRTALKKSGCKAPYILVAHSLGGDYATYWENTYPDEIKAVIYFDPNYVLGDSAIIDETIDEAWWGETPNSLDPVFQKIGLARLYAEFAEKPWISIIKTDNEEHKKAFWEHSMSTFAQNSEQTCSIENMKKTASVLKANDIPKLYIDASYYTKEDMIEYYGNLYESGLANFDTDINPENTENMDRIWQIRSKSNQETYDRFIKSYVQKLGNCKYVNISGDHYIYSYKLDEVSKVCAEFLDEIG